MSLWIASVEQDLTAIYQVEVEAASEEEARERILDGEGDMVNEEIPYPDWGGFNCYIASITRMEEDDA